MDWFLQLQCQERRKHFHVKKRTNKGVDTKGKLFYCVKWCHERTKLGSQPLNLPDDATISSRTHWKKNSLAQDEQSWDATAKASQAGLQMAVGGLDGPTAGTGRIVY